jgi:DNA invertase Pin-like site-specific DNA recombinase
MAVRHGWPVVLQVADEGRSAYRGDNIHTGNLGKLTKRLLAGEIDPALTIIIVEELDRLSRQDALTILAWMTPLLQAGVSFGIANDDEIIDLQLMTNDMGRFMMWLMKVFGNNAESTKKANRLASAWTQKRKRLRAGETVVVNHRHPQWIEVAEGAEGKEYRLIANRVRLVREIFALHKQGFGKGAIAKIFNQRGLGDPDYETWPLGKRKAKAWSSTYVGRILHGPAVLGWWQPHSGKRSGKRQPLGKPILLYPPAVPQSEFDRVNDPAERRERMSQGKGRAISNLLGTKARCALCGGQMTPLGSSRTRINRDGSKSQHYFLYCHNTKVARTCKHTRGWTYARFVEPLLDHLLTKAMDDQHFSAHDDTTHLHEGEVIHLRRQIDEATKGAQRLAKLIRTNDDPILIEEYEDVSEELRALQVNLLKAQDRLAAARGAVSPQEHIRRVDEVRADMESEDDDVRWRARSRVKAALHAVIDSISFDPTKGVATVKLVGDIAVLFVTDEGHVTSFNLHKKGRSYDSLKDAAAVKAYVRRLEASA